MTSLVVVPDGRVGPHPKPLRDRLILLLLDGKRPLGAESLVGRLEEGSEGGNRVISGVRTKNDD